MVYPWLFLERPSSSISKLSLSKKHKFLKFAYLLVPSIILAWIIGQTDRIILGWMLTSAELGVYAFSAILASYIVFISYSIILPLSKN